MWSVPYNRKTLIVQAPGWLQTHGLAYLSLLLQVRLMLVSHVRTVMLLLHLWLVNVMRRTIEVSLCQFYQTFFPLHHKHLGQISKCLSLQALSDQPSLMNVSKAC